MIFPESLDEITHALISVDLKRQIMGSPCTNNPEYVKPGTWITLGDKSIPVDGSMTIHLCGLHSKVLPCPVCAEEAEK